MIYLALSIYALSFASKTSVTIVIFECNPSGFLSTIPKRIYKIQGDKIWLEDRCKKIPKKATKNLFRCVERFKKIDKVDAVEKFDIFDLSRIHKFNNTLHCSVTLIEYYKSNTEVLYYIVPRSISKGPIIRLIQKTHEYFEKESNTKTNCNHLSSEETAKLYYIIQKVIKQ